MGEDVGSGGRGFFRWVAEKDRRVACATRGDGIGRGWTKSGIDPFTTQHNVPAKTATLAYHYDPPAMPPALAKAHAELDRAVDLSPLHNLPV